MAEEKKGILHKIFTVLEHILGDRKSIEEKGMKSFLRRTARIIIGSIRKFLDDEGLLRAASISYSLVVSFVPILVVVLLVGAKIIEKEQYYLFAREFIRKHGIPIDPDPYFNIINELLNNASAVTGVGFIVLLFSATSVLRNMEAAMNTIWRVKKGRPWLQKISGFLLVLIFGPIFITIGMSMGKNIVNRTAAPGLLSFSTSNQHIVSVGEKAEYLSNSTGKWSTQNILSNIDFQTQKETIIFNKEANAIITGEEKDALMPKIYHPTKRDLYWRTFKSFTNVGERSWIVTDNGCIISTNTEEIWNIQCFEREDFKLLFKVEFNKVVMFDTDNGFILGKAGVILRTTNGGQSWIPYNNSLITADLNDIIRIGEEKYIIVGNGFNAYLTEDSGKSWKMEPSLSKLMNKDRANLTVIRKFNNTIWITGDFGTLLKSTDSGQSWKRLNLGIVRNEFSDILFINQSEGYLLGENGFLRYTFDGGRTWIALDSKTNENLHSAIYSNKNGIVFICGDGSLILKNSEKEPKTFSVIQKSPFGRAMFYALGSIVLPFIFIGIIFFLIYKIMPFTDVMNKAAIYGAAVTSLLYVLFLFLFKYYVSSFSNGTFAIYGTLAAIPLSLLLVYASAGIMIYGAEIAFFIQNPGLLKISGLSLKIHDEKKQMWYGVKILYVLYNNYEKGKGSTKESDLVRICHNDYIEFANIIEKFMDRNILERTSQNRYVPVISSHLLKMNEIMDDIDPSDYHIPDEDTDNVFKNRIAAYFHRIQASRSDISKELTFADLFYGGKSLP